MKKWILIISSIITSLSITGIGFIDNLVWDKIMAITITVASGIVGTLYSFGVLSKRGSGAKAYIAILLLLLCAEFYIYKGIIDLQNWIISWELWVKILIPAVIGLCFIGIIIWISYSTYMKRKSKLTNA